MLRQSDIRLANADEAKQIARMSRDWIEHGLGWSWTPGRVRHAIDDPATNVAVVFKQAQLCGFGIMQYADEHAHLVLMAIEPAQRHQGLGKQLLCWLELSARTAGLASIRLEARADNSNAIAFYQHLGYRRSGTVSGYYEGVVDAAQFAKKLG